jgi:release factor glutamine methyltransferase
MTIQEASRYSYDKLVKLYGPGEANAIADWLMEHVTEQRKTTLAANQKTTLNDQQIADLESSLTRLSSYEPIQYVLNEAWFCGLKFYVDRNVLIPRPETEELVDWIITNCKFPLHDLSILDIGTGSGCISISLKRRLGKAEVWATDISRDALDVAKRNATGLGVTVNFVEQDFLSPVATDELPRFDIIVSNPPYIPIAEKTSMQRNVTDYEPGIALFVPDKDPLVFYEAIAQFGREHLKDSGCIYVELYEELAEEVARIFREHGYDTERKIDMQGKPRMLKAARKEA